MVTSFDCSALLLEGVAATVEDEVITIRELDEQYSIMKKTFPEITREEVLDTTINRIILLREARSMRLVEERRLYPGQDDDRIIDEYIELKIKAGINIKEEEIQNYYEAHKSRFPDMAYHEVAEDIERLITEQKTNELLKEHIKELRKKYYIKVYTIQ